MLRVLDLFSGIGGFSLGLERTGGFETAAFCEYAEWPRKVLAKHWPNVPIFEDVRTLKGSDIDGPIDVVVGGYPCQPFSTAGRRKGKEDDRHLWPEFNRLVAELRPTWVIGENVAGHISMGLDDVLSDLEGQGYACRTFVIPACAKDAPHRRDRCWTIGYTDSDIEPASPFNAEAQGLSALAGTEAMADAGGAGGERRGQRRVCPSSDGTRTEGERMQSDIETAGRGEDVAHADSEGPQRRQEARNARGKRSRRDKQFKRCGDDQGPARPTQPRMGGMADGLSARLDGHSRWPDEPDIPRVAKGVKDRANRLKALGNAVVPQIPEMIGRAILEAEENG
jgi:DNA (cytosine-5)-methyltransferase 1